MLVRKHAYTQDGDNAPLKQYLCQIEWTAVSNLLILLNNQPSPRCTTVTTQGSRQRRTVVPLGYRFCSVASRHPILAASTTLKCCRKRPDRRTAKFVMFIESVLCS